MIELNGFNLRSWATNLGVTLLIIGFILVVFFLFEPTSFNKTATDVGFICLGLSVQLLGVGFLIIGKE